MRILIDAVLEKNLGDDLFLNILADRYKEQFIGQSRLKYSKNELPTNVKLYSGLSVDIINKFGSKILNKGKIFSEVLKKECDMLIGIGGSIFMEWGEIEAIKRHFYIYNDNLPYYIIGANFGPYKTKEFYSFIKNQVIKNAKDVCFREEYSYDLFKKFDNIRFASDIVFTLNTNDLTMKNEKRVVFSVIDAKKKNNCKNELYEKKIIELIDFFINRNYKITLMSFCKEEGDEKAVQSILNKTNNDRSEIDTYYYRGNIKEGLNVISDSQIVVGTRFHANILGLVMNKTIIPIAYSDKTLNVLKDMNFKGKIFDMRDDKKFDVNDLSDEDLNYKMDISYQRKDAQRQFEKLDLVLKRKEQNE